MFSRIQRYLTLFCGASAGVVLGRWLFFAWDYTAHPDLYAMFSAPWWVQPAVDTAIGAGLILNCACRKSAAVVVGTAVSMTVALPQNRASFPPSQKNFYPPARFHPRPACYWVKGPANGPTEQEDFL